MDVNTVEFHTSQNVTINYSIASIGDRIVAAIIDWVIKIGYIFVLIFGITLVSPSSSPKDYLWIILIAIIPIFLYSLVFEYFMLGQTPGKKALKIKVVRLDGTQPTLGAYIIRWLFRLIDCDILYGVVAIITIAINKKGQRVGDILAETTVIKVQNRVWLKDTIYERVNSDYVAKYPEVKKLSPEDIQLIKRVLNTPDYRSNFEMVFNLTNKIQAKMNVSRVEGPEDFLQIVVKDYNTFYDE